MDKKTNVPKGGRPQQGRKPSRRLASLEPIQAQVPQARARANTETIIRPENRRIVIEQTPRLAPNLPDTAIGSDLLAGRETVRRQVMMLGLRGIPDVQGGIEKHVEMLSQELVVRGWDVEVVGRRRYMTQKNSFVWRGIRVTPMWAARSMFFETLMNSLAGVFYAAWRRPDILHIHAVGPGLLAPLARLLGLKVVVTHHGFDYDREKWGPIAKRVLRLGERFSMRFANGAIAVSRDVTNTMKTRYGARIAHVPNGVTVRPSMLANSVLERFNLRRRRYVVLVSRMVPEKRHTDLIAAFAKLGPTDWKLVLVGGADHAGTAYAAKVEAMAAGVEGVVMTGFQSGDDLAALFSQAGLFVLPSTHEGMPIALLEAMSYGLPVLASDIVANHEVELPPEDYFPVGDVDALSAAIARKIAEPVSHEAAYHRVNAIERGFTWASISKSTIDVYKAAMKPITKKNKQNG